MAEQVSFTSGHVLSADLVVRVIEPIKKVLKMFISVNTLFQAIRQVKGTEDEL